MGLLTHVKTTKARTITQLQSGRSFFCK